MQTSYFPEEFNLNTCTYRHYKAIANWALALCEQYLYWCDELPNIELLNQPDTLIPELGKPETYHQRLGCQNQSYKDYFTAFELKIESLALGVTPQKLNTSTRQLLAQYINQMQNYATKHLPEMCLSPESSLTQDLNAHYQVIEE